ncbi:MAG TPA: hypothetical protein VL860_03890 [Planctomycetota bacterium]|nr:hypothetical protein [Planctomycetota bacterium]
MPLAPNTLAVIPEKVPGPTPSTAPTFTHPAFSLNVIHVASPCSADWAAMTGDAQARHCGQCHKNVYNLSAMTEADALALIRAKEGHLCVRFFQRADGTVLTQDCPVGLLAKQRAQLRAAWAKASAQIAAIAMLTFGFFGFGCTARGTATGASSTNGTSAIGLQAPLPTPPPAVMGKMVMGDYCPAPMPPPVTAPPPSLGPVNPRSPAAQ